MRNLSTFKHILDLVSQCLRPDSVNFFQFFPNLSNLAFCNCSKNVQNVIHMALKWLFFLKKIARIALATGALPQAVIAVTCSFTHNLHYQQLSKFL